MDSIFDAEELWKDFVENTVGLPTEESDPRYIRINPAIDIKSPELDAADQLRTLREMTKRAIKTEKTAIQSIARTLISSSFYFDMTTPPKAAEGPIGFKCRGRTP